MALRRHQQPLNRQQNMLLPSRVEGHVRQNNTVRAIEAYVNTLDLHQLDFNNTQLLYEALSVWLLTGDS